MCDCIKTLKDTVLKKLQNDKKDLGIVNKGDFKNYGFRFGQKSFCQTYNYF